MRIVRWLGWFLGAIALVVFAACTAPPPPTATSTAPSGTSTPQHGMAHSGKQININNAILSELDKIEGRLAIPALSNKIQAERPYGKIEELVSKRVITQEQFDQIKSMVTVEEIVLTGEAKDVDYMTKLGLMKGHMMVAKELLDLQKPDQAEPHIGHPVEEIYADVEEQLSERKVPEFKKILMDLQALVKAGAKDVAKVETDFKASLQAIDTAIAALPDAQRQDPKFVMQVINGLLDTANSEYGAAIINGKIAQVIEYQDSRGFVQYADQLYKAIVPKLTKPNLTAKASLELSMGDLLKVWPTPLPPATPVHTPEGVLKLVKAVEMHGQALVSSS